MGASWRRDVAHHILVEDSYQTGNGGGLQKEPNIHRPFSLPQSVFLLKGFIKERIWQIEGLLKISTDGSQAKGIEREKVSNEEAMAPLLN